MPLYTPLRYPGGKKRLVSVVKCLLEANGLSDVRYVEPCAGGAAIALAVLYENYATSIHINDLDRAVYAFWHTALNETEWLCRRIERVRVSIRVWRQQREVYRDREQADLDELGFATLFLNRTNRSGILKGGVIGGQDQTGDWGIDARFNRRNIIDRIRMVGRYSNRIHLHQMDARAFVDEVIPKLGKSVFTFLDPPYIDSGQGLYLNNYAVDDHRRLAKSVSRLKSSWIVTYDHAAIAHKLYGRFRRIVYDLHYVTNDRYLGREVMFVSNGLHLPALPYLLGARMHLVRHQTRLKTA